ncbi:MAG: FHA domain-containing protein [Clostridiales bacterium]|nr:FHA domain-containing protein [Clostridiales bacterium]
MTQSLRDSKKIEYELSQEVNINKYELNAFNIPFAGNTSTCREIFVRGDRKLEFSVDGDISLGQIMQKPVFRDELVEYVYSISRQLVSIIQNGMSPQKIILNCNDIYVRLSDFSVQLLYLPLDNVVEESDIAEFVKNILSNFVYAHTPAIECANQIVDYFNDHSEFDAFHFRQFVSELRDTSQLLIIQGDKGQSEVLVSPENNKERAIHKAEEAAKKAEAARVQAENEVKRQIEEAKYQAEVARQAEEARMKAEAARVEAEIWRQKVAAEVRDYEETAVLTSENIDISSVEEERQKAEKVSSKYADEIRRAREQEMRAEEARMQAEFAARKNAEEAKRQAEFARRQAEEIKRLSESDDEEPPTTLFSNRTLVSGSKPTLTRRSTGETVQINKQVFCIGKADQGVDFKITGNRSISRRHAYITSINGVSYLRDNNSTNHTYLNGSQVYSNMDVVIPDNSIIKLSNEEFVYKNM